MHYLDDFLLIGAPASVECDAHLSTLLTTFDRLGLPVAPKKLEGPTTRVTFLGIELDTHNNYGNALTGPKARGAQGTSSGMAGCQACNKG